MKARSIALALMIGVALLVAAAGCSGGSSEEVERQSAIIDELIEVSDEMETSFHDSASKVLAARQEGLPEAEGKLEEFRKTAAVHALDGTAGIPDPPSDKVALRFSFAYQGEPLPGDGLVVYEASPDVNTVWAMESLPKGQEVPAGPPLEERTIFLAPGERTTVTLVYKNPTDQEVGWLALPHQETPGSLHTKTWLTCFCLAFIYEAPAEGAWYRVIGVRVSPDMPAGSKVDARWTILTDPSVFPTD